MQPADQDAEHLRLLVIFHYIWAAFQATGGLFGLVFLGVGSIFLAAGPQQIDARNPPPPWMGALFAGIGALLLVIFLAWAALVFLTGRFLAQRRHHTFCLVISAINCLSIPMGTAIGVFTILVLTRPSVKQMFSASANPPGPGTP